MKIVYTVHNIFQNNRPVYLEQKDLKKTFQTQMKVSKKISLNTQTTKISLTWIRSEIDSSLVNI